MDIPLEYPSGICISIWPWTPVWDVDVHLGYLPGITIWEIDIPDGSDIPDRRPIPNTDAHLVCDTDGHPPQMPVSQVEIAR